MTYLYQILPAFVLPLGVALMLLVWGLVTRRRRVLIGAALLLWGASMPLVADPLMELVEGRQVRMPAAEAPTTDAIVVLSGGRTVAPGPGGVSEWTDADRYFGGLELWRAGRAPLLVYTANWLPWAPQAPSEGHVLAAYAIEAGVPSAAIAVTSQVSNTADEARAVAALMRERGKPASSVLLVTSAFHMSRARRVFEEQGLRVVPFPVDFKTSREGLSILSVVPDARALSSTQVALRELYGRLYYRVVGR